MARSNQGGKAAPGTRRAAAKLGAQVPHRIAVHFPAWFPEMLVYLAINVIHLRRLHDLRRAWAPFALLDTHVLAYDLRHTQLPEQIDRGSPSAGSGEQAGIDHLINLEGLQHGFLGRSIPPLRMGTHWMNPSKPDTARCRGSAGCWYTSSGGEIRA